MKKACLLIAFLASLICNLLVAESFDHRFQKAFNVQALSIDDGLSQSVVNEIIQDKNGYIWIATEDGLNKFNGYDFKVYQHIHGDLTTLNENLIFSLLEDSDDGIWVGTSRGLSYLDLNNNQFSNYTETTSGALSAVGDIAHFDQSTLLLATDNGLFTFDKDNKTIAIFTDSEGGRIEDEVVDIASIDNRFYFSTHHCIYRYTLESFSIEPLCNKNAQLYDLNRTNKTLAVSDSDLWLGTSNGLLKISLKSWSVNIYKNTDDINSLSNDWVQDILLDEKGKLWIGTASGLNYFEPETERFERFEKNIYDAEGISSNDIISVSTDSSGLIWLGTYTGGVNILDPIKGGFKKILSKSDASSFSSNNTVHGIVKDQRENLWLAVFGAGAVKVDLMTGEIHQVFSHQDDRLNYAYSLFVDSEEKLWIGTNEGLFIGDTVSGELFELSIELDGEPAQFNDYIFSIYEDHDGDLWIGTNEGIFYIERVEQKGTSLLVALRNKSGELPFSYRDRSSSIHSVLETRDGGLWLGGSAGLLYKSEPKGIWQHFRYEQSNTVSLSNDDVQAIFEDTRGQLWVGTANGLNRVIRDNPNEIYFERITRQNGLPNNAIYGILEDKQSQIWLSTNLGLVRLSDVTESLKAFVKADGLTSNEFNKGAFFADEDGLLFFGSINGVTVVDSKKVIESPRKARLNFSEIKINHEPISLVEYDKNSPIIIRSSTENSSIQVTVADLYYRKLATQDYRYRIRQLDKKWNYLGKSRQFTLAGLRAGNYEIEIQSKVGDELWDNSLISFNLLVEEAFWQSKNAFYLIIGIALFLILVIFLSTRYVYASRLQKQKKRLKVESIRLKEVKNQNEEIKIDLAKKVIEVGRLQNENEIKQLEIESYNFKDTVTGLYKFENIERMLLESGLEVSTDSSYNLVMALKLLDFDQIKNSYGLMSSSEVSVWVSQEIKRHTSSRTQVVSYSADTFLIFGNSVNDNNLSTTLLNLREYLERSHVAIANDLVVQTNVFCAYTEVFPDKINQISELHVLGEILATLNNFKDIQAHSRSIRVDLNKPIDEYIKTQFSVDTLVATNDITLHYL